MWLQYCLKSRQYVDWGIAGLHVLQGLKNLYLQLALAFINIYTNVTAIVITTVVNHKVIIIIIIKNSLIIILLGEFFHTTCV